MKVRFFLSALIALSGLMLIGCEPATNIHSGYAKSISIPPQTNLSTPSKEVPVDYVVLQKNDHILSLWKQGRLVKTYPVMALGANPIGQKVYEGDERTPEGHYFIEEKHPSQNFQKFLKISYPNEKDRELAKRFNMPPGGSVGIHGDRGGMAGFWQRFKKDWTDGCVAMRNADIEEIYEMVAVGTPILIKP